MSGASSEAVAILSFLLPGLVAVTVFHMFTSHPKPSEFERIVQALIFTILVQAIAELLLWIGRLLGHDALWREESEIMVSVGVALILGFIAVYLSNTDMLHRFVRFLRLSKETSYSSELDSAFYHNPDCYVVLHLQSRRRLYGWPQEWPSRPAKGHFMIAKGEWLTDDKRIPAAGVTAIVVPAKKVDMVEFLKSTRPDEDKEKQMAKKPTPPPARTETGDGAETRGRNFTPPAGPKPPPPPAPPPPAP